MGNFLFSILFDTRRILKNNKIVKKNSLFCGSSLSNGKKQTLQLPSFWQFTASVLEVAVQCYIKYMKRNCMCKRKIRLIAKEQVKACKYLGTIIYNQWDKIREFRSLKLFFKKLWLGYYSYFYVTR